MHEECVPGSYLVITYPDFYANGNGLSFLCGICRQFSITEGSPPPDPPPTAPPKEVFPIKPKIGQSFDVCCM